MRPGIQIWPIKGLRWGDPSNYSVGPHTIYTPTLYALSGAPPDFSMDNIVFVTLFDKRREKYNTLNTGASHGVAWLWLCLQLFLFLSQIHIKFRLPTWGKKKLFFFLCSPRIHHCCDWSSFFHFLCFMQSYLHTPMSFFGIFRDPINFVPSICPVHNLYQNKCFFFNTAVFRIRLFSKRFFFTFSSSWFCSFYLVKHVLLRTVCFCSDCWRNRIYWTSTSLGLKHTLTDCLLLIVVVELIFYFCEERCLLS